MHDDKRERNDHTADDLERARLVGELGSLVLKLLDLRIRPAVIASEVLFGDYFLGAVAMARSADPVSRRRGLDRLRRLVENGRRAVGWIASDALDEIRAEQERRRRARGEQP